ncbi:hypothetical protein Aduo_017183 [Ancylostoma duodenale]
MPVNLPLESFAEVDQIFGTENVRPGYDILKKRYEGGDKSSELLWRLAKFCHELACRTTDKGKKKELILEGWEYVMVLRSQEGGSMTKPRAWYADLLGMVK